MAIYVSVLRHIHHDVLDFDSDCLLFVDDALADWQLLRAFQFVCLVGVDIFPAVFDAIRG
jgi:hypothetical protein